jgi:diphthamide biosynthesis protein 3
VGSQSMGPFYDEVELEDFSFDAEDRIFYYPCPCGDRFQITEEELSNGEEIARCPSCSLMILVIYDLGSRKRKDPETECSPSIVEIVG